jgi:predicted TIM-barrel fold metal-dependent hydrolase
MMDRSWLSGTSEEAIEPDLEIVDPHHHLWDTVTRYGRYELDDLRTDTGAGHRVVQTVFIDCGANYRTTGPERLRPVGETEYVAGRAAESDRTEGAVIAAIVGHADLGLGPGVAEVLEAHLVAADGRFRGIRHSGARAEDPAVPPSRAEPPAGLYRQAPFVAGARALAGLDLSFEAWQYHHQLDDVLALAREVPELPIVVNHLGGPLGIGGYAGRWDEIHHQLRLGLEPLAGCGNVVVKLGGVGMTRFGTGWEDRPTPPTSTEVVEVWGDLIRWTIDTFGPDRCMFESNYPVDGETVGYAVLWNAFKKLSSDYDRSERADLFAGTARRVYRLAAD